MMHCRPASHLRVEIAHCCLNCVKLVLLRHCEKHASSIAVHMHASESLCHALVSTKLMLTHAIIIRASAGIDMLSTQS